MNGKLPLPKLDKDNIIEILLRKPWPYWLGGVLLALSNILYLLLTGDYWAITTGFTRFGAWILSLFGVDIQVWEVWEYYEYVHPLFDIRTWSNFGIIVGALIAILLARQFRLKKIKNKKQFITVFIGGWLMGYGARVAIGCNIGGLYSAIASLSLSGWLYLPFIALGIFIGSKTLVSLIKY